jgi:hypothetical protein
LKEISPNGSWTHRVGTRIRNKGVLVVRNCQIPSYLPHPIPLARPTAGIRDKLHGFVLLFQTTIPYYNAQSCELSRQPGNRQSVASDYQGSEDGPPSFFILSEAGQSEYNHKCLAVPHNLIRSPDRSRYQDGMGRSRGRPQYNVPQV